MGHRIAAAPVFALVLGACVADTTVYGDDRSRAACAEAPLLELPLTGCETITIASRSPIGCEVRADDGTPLEDRHGSWVRLRRPADRPAFMRVVDLDATHGAPSASLHLTTGDAAPCTCVITQLDSGGISTETFEWPLRDLEQQVLFSSPHTFEVSICNQDADPLPECARPRVADGAWCAGRIRVEQDGFCGCLSHCLSTVDCPAARTGTAPVECVEGACIRRCEDTSQCPSGLECVAGPTGSSCLWPM